MSDIYCFQAASMNTRKQLQKPSKYILKEITLSVLTVYIKGDEHCTESIYAHWLNISTILYNPLGSTLTPSIYIYEGGVKK
jgi:hypothetical protein